MRAAMIYIIGNLPLGSGRWSYTGTEAHGPCGPLASPAWCSRPLALASRPHQSNWHALWKKSRWVQRQLSGDIPGQACWGGSRSGQALSPVTATFNGETIRGECSPYYTMSAKSHNLSLSALSEMRALTLPTIQRADGRMKWSYKYKMLSVVHST